MERKHYAINKYASIIYRIGNIYFDQELADHGIGSGQMFFLLRISEQEGISMLELGMTGFFDKGTTTRAVQKLEELSYVYRKIDEEDKRIQHLYLTPKGYDMVPKLIQMLHEWERIVLMGVSNTDEIDKTLSILQHMSTNAYAFIEERKKR